jgi:hypothetical protein
MWKRSPGKYLSSLGMELLHCDKRQGQTGSPMLLKKLIHAGKDLSIDGKRETVYISGHQ